VEAMNRVGGPVATPGPDSERRHMFSSIACRWYASRLPLREMAGEEASPPVYCNCSGAPSPEAGTFQRLHSLPLTWELKMISRPFGVQAESRLKPFKNVSRLGSPLGFKSSVRPSR